MTTDDGLKGLTDAQLCELFICMHKVYEDSPRLECDAEIVSAARAWLSANVHDSGDGERYQHMRLHGVITGETSKDGCEWIYGDELDSQIDAAILAEKGNDNA